MVGANLRGMPASCVVLDGVFDDEMRRLDHLQLSESETTTGANATVVFNRWASDDWSKLVNGSRCDSSCLCLTSIAAS